MSDTSLARPHPRRIGWFGAAGLAMGGSNQSLFLIGALLASQGSAAIPLLAIGLVVSWMAVPGWIELGAMFPDRVGGIAATCAEAFRPYSAVLANLTGTCYWWGWVPTCGVTALLSASALHQWYLPGMPVTLLAVLIVTAFCAVNLCGVRWAARLAAPMACVSAALALVSTVAPVLAGRVDWRRASSFHLISPFHGAFGGVTSAMAGLYLIGFAAPAFEAAACHVGEMRDPDRDYPRAMWVAAGTATVYFVLLPVVWLGVFGPTALQGDLASLLGPTFAPLLGGMAKAAAIWFMAINMFHGTLQPLSGASRTLSQLAEDGLLPRSLARRLPRTDAPYVALAVTALASIAFLLANDPTWIIAAANLTYLIGIALPSVAVWLLRRNEPDRHRPYRARRGNIALGLVAAAIWLLSTMLGFEQFGLPTVLFGLALAYSGAAAYAWRTWSDGRRTGRRTHVRSIHLKLTGSMLLVLSLDGLGYLLAVNHVMHGDPALVATLKDIFVAVALLTISVGLVLPGMIAHASGQVAAAADTLANGTLTDFTLAMEALAGGRLEDATADGTVRPIVVYARDEIGSMAESFNTMQRQMARAVHALDSAREELRSHRDNLERLVEERTVALVAANDHLEQMQADRRELLDRTVRVAEEERSRVAADLHDGPIQRLAALMFLLDRTGLRVERDDLPGAGELLDRARRELEGEINGLRRIMSELRPPVLDQGGLVAAVRDLASEHHQRTGMDVQLDVEDVTGLSRDAETVLYRVVQEALVNAAKHSRGTSVSVSLSASPDGATVAVADDGEGFVLQPGSGLVRDGHFGLAVMRERMDLAGGQFQITSAPGRGTRVAGFMPTTGERSGYQTPLARAVAARTAVPAAVGPA